ncbi:MAG: hypothetical protein WA061_01795 [Microgenomates group bacterium]
MTYLVAKAYYNNEDRGEEYSPSRFVLEITREVINELKHHISDVSAIYDADFISAKYYFGGGIWIAYNEWIEDNLQEEIEWVDGEFNEELEEQEYLECYTVLVEKDGDIQFKCRGKWDDEEIYMCRVNIRDLENNIKGE